MTVNKERKPGFLRIKTNLFDRVFISVMIFVGLHLIWMRFIEQHIPLSVATVISVVLGFVIIKWG
ncbi:MAG TPA: hypothetical protein ENG15_05710 [Thermotoga sp.]|nr:hypothetical protein [Candidatus Neomarinimicrobiota bacterium]RKX41121.1 MAG: hypothetical protein DRP23_01425 [Thermotogota bacterium]RKX53246.1 MAG: hypothetical protein DRP25_00750 [Thermotoga sp.]HDG62480.1 hypothetical protein [Thermotoga sp.]